MCCFLCGVLSVRIAVLYLRSPMFLAVGQRRHCNGWFEDFGCLGVSYSWLIIVCSEELTNPLYWGIIQAILFTQCRKKIVFCMFSKKLCKGISYQKNKKSLNFFNWYKWDFQYSLLVIEQTKHITEESVDRLI
jgi:hypothetical protein